jgi:cell division protein FtsI (penicillin-binding protein 3)
MISEITKQIKRKLRAFALQLISGIFYLQQILFQFKSFFQAKSSATPRYVKEFKLSLQDGTFKKSFFAWDLKDSAARFRIQIAIFAFTFVFLVIAVRLIVVASSEYAINSRAGGSGPLHRLDIVDRNNNLLAVNLPSASLYANPKKVIEPELVAKQLHSVIPSLGFSQILSQLKSEKNFVWIKRDLSPQEYQKIYNLGLPGFEFEREEKRIYTYGNLLSHVIGYVGRDLKGLSGIEQYFENFLTEQQEAEDRRDFGDNLRLSIDVRVQNILSEEMDRTIKKFSAKGAAGIVVDPNNGEILALVSKPDFDPHHPGKASPEQLFNMATQGVYELGSGMKSLTMAIGFDTNSISIQDAYDLSYMRVNGFQVKDTHPMKGWQSVPQIFLKSSNIGVAQIMLEVGRDNLADYLRKLNMLDKLNIELPERGRPLFPPSSRWTDLSLVTMSYGYGLSASPLHFVQAMVPVVNGGVLYPLTLLKRDEKKEVQGERVFTEETSSSMRKLMRLGISKGTGSKAEVKGYYAGGKTGTAEIAHAGRYDKNRRMSSFFGIIPATKPKYIVYVIYNEPKGIKESFGFAGGGWVAAPTVGVVFEKLAGLYGMEKLDEDSPEVQEIDNVEYKVQDEA